MGLKFSAASEKDWEVASTHRTAGIDIKPMLSRDEPGASFEFNLVRFGGEDFWSPRHRHNFDQIRIGLEGETFYGKMALKPRSVGYFPESTWYGPLSVKQPSIQAIIQLDGPSRCGYVTYNHLDPATEELREEGTFEGGFWVSPNGEKIDGYQASWERATGAKMVYPKRRYTEPIYMDIDAYEWDEPTSNSDVVRKNLGIFNERQTSFSVVKLAPEAVTKIGSDDRSTVAFILSGGISITDRRMPKWEAVLLENCTEEVQALDEGCEIIEVGLPMFDETSKPVSEVPAGKYNQVKI